MTHHFIGIGGIGMSALAHILLDQGHRVTGSDLKLSSVVRQLQQRGATIFLGQAAENIDASATVVYTTDVKADNVELVEAKRVDCPLLHRSDLLQRLTLMKRPLAVAGTHGKTTTSALLTAVLSRAGWRPSYAVGGIITELGNNGGWGGGDYFVLEADESDGTFLKYAPVGAIVTNVEAEHLNHYGTEEAMQKAYLEFMCHVEDTTSLFWCGDDPVLAGWNYPGVSYGFGPNCQLLGSRFRVGEAGIVYDVSWEGHLFRNVEVSLWGSHNALNSLAVFGMALALGISEEAIRSALKAFRGAKRRLEVRGQVRGALVLDDYGHHPTEVLSTLRALRQAMPTRRLLVAFQPHRYTRTQACLDLFGNAFDSADLVVLTDIYGAGEKPIPGVTTEAFVSKVKEHSRAEVQWAPRNQIARVLFDKLRPEDLLVTMGAGDITEVATEMQTHESQG